MKTSSAKAKGRRLAQLVKDTFLQWAPDLKQDDIIVTSSGTTGEDLQLSPAARLVYNYAIECKNVEKLNVWDAYAQACTHVKDDRTPVLVFCRNRAKPMVAISLDDFMKLTR